MESSSHTSCPQSGEVTSLQAARRKSTELRHKYEVELDKAAARLIKLGVSPARAQYLTRKGLARALKIYPEVGECYRLKSFRQFAYWEILIYSLNRLAIQFPDDPQYVEILLKEMLNFEDRIKRPVPQRIAQKMGLSREMHALLEDLTPLLHPGRGIRDLEQVISQVPEQRNGQKIALKMRAWLHQCARQAALVLGMPPTKAVQFGRDVLNWFIITLRQIKHVPILSPLRVTARPTTA